eukprot:gnl/MRDRNA2_/MRDRNA2_82008_c0_seq1.p1 gnl/MRDRNA2_/MRDRNA2_82008_c0~~gnl/MRDRNA2_/MRDRNA2_82008_c0_seq1.p1  ORF type:complete len:318 (-),score=64.63 gnl/MRDRNA2_/MRDRNA2_82008_c0_seq1:37-936(-)
MAPGRAEVASFEAQGLAAIAWAFEMSGFELDEDFLTLLTQTFMSQMRGAHGSRLVRLMDVAWTRPDYPGKVHLERAFHKWVLKPLLGHGGFIADEEGRGIRLKRRLKRRGVWVSAVSSATPGLAHGLRKIDEEGRAEVPGFDSSLGERSLDARDVARDDARDTASNGVDRVTVGQLGRTSASATGEVQGHAITAGEFDVADTASSVSDPPALSDGEDGHAEGKSHEGTESDAEQDGSEGEESESQELPFGNLDPLGGLDLPIGGNGEDENIVDEGYDEHENRQRELDTADANCVDHSEF